jgi:predicted DNA-binding protein
MSSQPVKNLHVPLPDHLHVRLKLRSAKTGRPATVLVREAIHRWLDWAEEVERDAAIEDYARAVAGTEDDLNPALENAALEIIDEQERNVP